jgi:hypothetical protein
MPKCEAITSSGNKLSVFRSYKTNRVTVTVTVGGVPFSLETDLEEKKLNSAIEEICKLSDGSDPIQGFVEGLMLAQWRYVSKQVGTKKARGVQAPLVGILFNLKNASVWTYQFVIQEWKKPFGDRYVPLQRAEKKLEELRDGHPCRSEIELTAFLVFHAYKEQLRNTKIKNPWKSDFSDDNYFRRYIKPKNDWVLAKIDRNPKLMATFPEQPFVSRDADNAQEAWKTACKNGRLLNAPLREVFTPWL